MLCFASVDARTGPWIVAAVTILVVALLVATSPEEARVVSPESIWARYAADPERGILGAIDRGLEEGAPAAVLVAHAQALGRHLERSKLERSFLRSRGNKRTVMVLALANARVRRMMPDLRELLRGEGPRAYRLEAIRLVQQLRGGEAAGELRVLASGEDAQLAAAARATLEVVGVTLVELQQALNGPDPARRVAAAHEMAWRDDLSPRTRQYAILWALRKEIANPVESGRFTSVELRLAYHDAAERLAPRTKGAIGSSIPDSAFALREHLSVLLACTGDDQWIAEARRLLVDSPVVGIRVRAGRCLGRHSLKDTGPALEKALGDAAKDALGAEVREAAARSLEAYGMTVNRTGETWIALREGSW